MVAFTYIAKRDGGEWKASRISSEEGPELSADASDSYALQKELKKISIDNSAGGAVQTLLSTINEDTLIFQVLPVKDDKHSESNPQSSLQPAS